MEEEGLSWGVDKGQRLLAPFFWVGEYLKWVKDVGWLQQEAWAFHPQGKAGRLALPQHRADALAPCSHCGGFCLNQGKASTGATAAEGARNQRHGGRVHQEGHSTRA